MPKQPGTVSPSRSGQATVYPSQQSVRVHVDPKTGKLVRGAVAARARELSPRERNMVSRSADGLTARTLPNGTVALNLSGRFRNLIRVELGEDEAGLKTVCLINDPSTDSGNPGSP